MILSNEEIAEAMGVTKDAVKLHLKNIFLKFDVSDRVSAVREAVIRIYMTPERTPYRFHTFLEDPVYRLSVAAQNNGYNILTGTGFYFGPDLLGHGLWFRGTWLE